jgi:hypothetical protein
MSTIDIAFFTTGDLATESTPDSDHGDRHPRISIELASGPTLTNQTPTTSQVWEARAMALATRGQVHGVKTTDDARGVLDALPAGTTLRDLFFVGHGFPGGYVFSGRRTGPQGASGPFLSQAAATLQAPSSASDQHARFFASLANRLSRQDHGHVLFLSCFTGAAPSDATSPSQGRLDVALAATLQREGFHQFSVGCYVDFYAVRPVVSTDTRRILHFVDRVVFAGTTRSVPGHDLPGPDHLPRLQKMVGQIPSTRLRIG